MPFCSDAVGILSIALGTKALVDNPAQFQSIVLKSRIVGTSLADDISRKTIPEKHLVDHNYRGGVIMIIRQLFWPDRGLCCEAMFHGQTNHKRFFKKQASRQTGLHDRENPESHMEVPPERAHPKEPFGD